MEKHIQKVFGFLMRFEGVKSLHNHKYGKYLFNPLCQALNQAHITTETWVETITEGHTNMPNFNNVESEAG